MKTIIQNDVPEKKVFKKGMLLISKDRGNVIIATSDTYKGQSIAGVVIHTETVTNLYKVGYRSEGWKTEFYEHFRGSITIEKEPLLTDDVTSEQLYVEVRLQEFNSDKIERIPIGDGTEAQLVEYDETGLIVLRYAGANSESSGVVLYPKGEYYFGDEVEGISDIHWSYFKGKITIKA